MPIIRWAVKFRLCIGASALLWGMIAYAAAPAGERQALVLGVGDPSHEAAPDGTQKLLSLLGALHFEVHSLPDPTLTEIRAALADFKSHLVPGGTALIMYIGHGSRVGDVDYLRPKNSGSTRAAVAAEWLRLNEVVQVLEDADVETRLLFVDACRNEMFTNLPPLGEPEAVEHNTVISFAAAPDRIVQIPSSGPDAYIRALLKFLPLAGLELSDLYKRVGDYVDGATHGRQTTWINSSYTGTFYFNSPLFLNAHIGQVDDELLLFVNGAVALSSSTAPKDSSFPVHTGINHLNVQIYNQHTFTGGVAFEDVNDALRQFNIQLPPALVPLIQTAASGREAEGWNYSLTLSGPNGPITPQPFTGGEKCVVKNGPHHGHWFQVASADIVVSETAPAKVTIENLNQDLWKQDAKDQTLCQ